MRRIFRDTTAIALTLSLGLPPAALAQTADGAVVVVPGDTAAAAAPAGADAPVVVDGNAPDAADPEAVLKKALKDEEKAKEAADKAEAKAEKAREKAEKAAEKAQDKADAAVEAVAVSERGAPVQEAAAKAAAAAENEADQTAAALEAAVEQERKAAQKERKAKEKAEVAAEKAKDKAARKAEQKAGKKADRTADGKDDKATPDAAALEQALKAKDEGAERAAGANAAAAARAAGADAPVVVTPRAAVADKADKADNGKAVDRAAKDAKDARPLVVTAPVDAKDAKPVVAASTEDAKDAKPVVVTAPVDAKVAAERDALEAALAEAKVIPESEAKATDASIEAAAAAAAPAAAALAADAKPVVVREKTEVTRQNSRAATEDFATDLSGAARRNDAAAAAAARNKGPVVVGDTAPANGDTPVVAGSQGNPKADADAAALAAALDKGPVVTDGPGDKEAKASKDEDSDLEQALKGVVLPALAGMVVGQMLSNNREVALNTGDRVVLTRADGSQEILKDDNALLLRPGSTVQTDEFADGSSRTVVMREDGSQVVTIRDANLRVLRRSVVHPDGTTTALIDETAAVQPVDVASLPAPAKPVVVLPGDQVSDEALREALRRETTVNRSFTLGQIRAIPEVRALVAPVDIQAITFDTGSAAIKPDQAQALASLGRVIAEQIRQNPGEVFLIEGHTDTVGKDAMNLALSDRRAESVALALTEFFQVPPENMVVQGYGEQFLKVAREGDVRANRRAAVRRITDLLARN